MRDLVYGQSDTHTLLQDGLEKVALGETSFDEILKLVDLENDLAIHEELDKKGLSTGSNLEAEKAAIEKKNAELAAAKAKEEAEKAAQAQAQPAAQPAATTAAPATQPAATPAPKKEAEVIINGTPATSAPAEQKVEVMFEGEANTQPAATGDAPKKKSASEVFDEMLMNEMQPSQAEATEGADNLIPPVPTEDTPAPAQASAPAVAQDGTQMVSSTQAAPAAQPARAEPQRGLRLPFRSEWKRRRHGSVRFALYLPWLSPHDCLFIVSNRCSFCMSCNKRQPRAERS